LLSVSSESDNVKISSMSDDEIEKMQRDASLNLLKKIDQKTQVLMIYFSLRRVHTNVTPDDVDFIITYGMEQAEYIKIVNFLLYGVTSEQVAELKEKDDTKNEKTAK